MAVVRYRDGNGNIVPLRVIKGENGHEMHVRFSAYADGKDMSEVWDDTRDYMGIAFAPTAPTKNADYQWIRVSHFPNGMTLDADNNLHVSGEEITFGVAKHKVASIETGSYVGTGATFDDNTNLYIEEEVSLTFPFAPKMLIIQGHSDVSSSSQDFRGAIWIDHKDFSAGYAAATGGNEWMCGLGGGSTFPITVSSDGKTFTWKTASGAYDRSLELLNYKNTTYSYVALA